VDQHYERGKGRVLIRLGCAALFLLFTLALVAAQTPQEHAQHHPATPPATTPAPAQPSMTMPGPPAEPSAQGGGMTGGARSGQLCCGGAPPPSPLYPAMMAMPELTPQRRTELEQQAGERMVAGSAMMSDAFGRLTAATQSGDAAAMQEANALVREGLGQFESGLALRRALAESRAPRDIALEWFRGEMNLVPLTDSPPPHGLFGLSWFHYIVMLILTAFAVSMVGMYFRKMRRAETLVARLAGAPGGTAVVYDVASPFVSPVMPAPQAAATISSTTEPAPRVSPVIAPSKSNSWTGLLRVARIFEETPTVKTFRLIDPMFGTLPFAYLPGQFLTVTVSVNGDSIKRSYSISSSPTERDYCEITVKREEQGAVSRFLHDQVHEHDTLQITAPSGRFTFTGEESTSVVLIGGGVGITPMMSVVRYLTKRSWLHDIYFVLAVRGEADIIFREELQYLQHRYPNLRVCIVAEEVEASDERYVKGRVTRQLLESRIPDLPARRVHICGPPPMMNAVKAILAEMGVPADQIRTELFQGKEPPRATLESVPAAQTKVAVVTFAKSNRTAMMPPTKTVLEASEDVGVNIEYSCRVGTCGVCRTKLLSGTVTMEVQDGLEPGDKENDIILACQAKSMADVAVEA
jgi:ferredoxin-NADP reductase